MDRTKHNAKKFSEFINETEQPVVHNTNFKGMVQGAVSSVHSQVLAIARALAEEKLARNPHRYNNAEKIAEVEEVDITRAINLIFHSDWKKLLKEHRIQEWAQTCLERAGKHDDRADKKNQRALRTMNTGKDDYKVNLGSQGHSRDSGSSGGGSNQ